MYTAVFPAAESARHLDQWQPLESRWPLIGTCIVWMRSADVDGWRDSYKKEITNITFREIIQNVEGRVRKIRKIRNYRSFSSCNLRTIACNLYPCPLVLIQKWQVPKHLDLKGRLMSGTLCKTNLCFMFKSLKTHTACNFVNAACYQPKFLFALNKSVLGFA